MILPPDSPLLQPIEGVANMSAHTPGPWAPSRYCTKMSNFGDLQNRIEARPLASASFGVAKAYGTDKSIVEANARLIAAAPDLLAALESIAAAPMIGGISAGERKGLERAAVVARAAIAKATGAA